MVSEMKNLVQHMIASEPSGQGTYRRALSNELLLRAVTGTSFFTIRDFWSGGKIGHQLCEKFETGKLDGVNLQSTSADEAQNAGDALWRLDAARATPK